MATLRALAASLGQQLNSPTDFRAVAIRVQLRTGVDIRAPRPEQDCDGSVVTRVRAVLADMGYQV